MRPIQSPFLSQKWGENKACINIHNRKITATRSGKCPSGTMNFYKAMGLKGHNGQDNGTYFREPVFFPVIADTEWKCKIEKDHDGGIGLDVFSTKPILLKMLPPQAGEQAREQFKKWGGYMYIKLRFWHAESNLVEHGDMVKVGDLIQLSDSTGASSGNHVHWSLKFVDKEGITMDKNNGYYGAVDFTLWYENKFILSELGLSLNLDTSQKLAKLTNILKHFPKYGGVIPLLGSFTSLLIKIGE